MLPDFLEAFLAIDQTLNHIMHRIDYFLIADFVYPLGICGHKFPSELSCWCVADELRPTLLSGC
jgi:hypothetical protein